MLIFVKKFPVLVFALILIFPSIGSAVEAVGEAGDRLHDGVFEVAGLLAGEVGDVGEQVRVVERHVPQKATLSSLYESPSPNFMNGWPPGPGPPAQL